MISRLTGTLTELFDHTITLDVHDVGYNVYVTEQWKAKSTVGSRYILSIATVMKEDSFELFGFATPQEKKLFLLLLSVSGIGPKTALSIVGYGVNAIHAAVVSADVDFFSAIPRIGKKNAQKIIIELKSKFGGMTDLDLTEDSGKRKELFDALISMGFARDEIQELIKTHIDETKSIEQNLKIALQLLGGRR